MPTADEGGAAESNGGSTRHQRPTFSGSHDDWSVYKFKFIVFARGVRLSTVLDGNTHGALADRM